MLGKQALFQPSIPKGPAAPSGLLGFFRNKDSLWLQLQDLRRAKSRLHSPSYCRCPCSSWYRRLHPRCRVGEALADVLVSLRPLNEVPQTKWLKQQESVATVMRLQVQGQSVSRSLLRVPAWLTDGYHLTVRAYPWCLCPNPFIIKTQISLNGELS